MAKGNRRKAEEQPENKRKSERETKKKYTFGRSMNFVCERSHNNLARTAYVFKPHVCECYRRCEVFGAPVITLPQSLLPRTPTTLRIYIYMSPIQC